MRESEALTHFPRIRPCGDAALTIEFGENIDEALNMRVLALNDALLRSNLPIVETIPTYRSLFVVYDPLTIDFEALSSVLMEMARRDLPPPPKGRSWRFPVCYGGTFGEDLPFVASHCKLTEGDVVRQHSAGSYRIYMMGFIPGFTYLGGLSPSLAVPRRNDPRLTSPAGTISIGGVQTGIQCLASPTGWHLIGRTPARTYDPDRSDVFFLEPGDTVSFFAVSPEDFAALERRADTGDRIAEEVAA